MEVASRPRRMLFLPVALRVLHPRAQTGMTGGGLEPPHAFPQGNKAIDGQAGAKIAAVAKANGGVHVDVVCSVLNGDGIGNTSAGVTPTTGATALSVGGSG
jgi:hypothetical protein